MADIARIGFSAETSDLKDAKASLEALVTAARRAENAARGVAAAASGLAGGIKPFNNAVQQAATGSGTFSRSALLAGTAMGTVQRAAAGAGAALDTLGGRVTRVGLTFAQADAHVEAYKRSLTGVAPAANGAKTALDRLGASANDNINRLQATPGNIAAQFQDVGVTAAAGMSPMLIALQQGTQLSAAMSGGLGNLVKGLKQVFSPVTLLTIGMVALVAVAIQMAMEFFTASEEASALDKALSDVNLTTSALGDVQGALGNIMDITTGKINTQSEALWGLARAQLEVIRATALRDQSEARKAMAEVSQSTFRQGSRALPGGGMYGSGLQYEVVDAPAKAILDGIQGGTASATQGIDALEKLRKQGELTEDQFISLIGAVSNFGMAAHNLDMYEKGRSALEGDKGALQEFLTPKTARAASSRKGPKTEAQKFEDIAVGAQADIATQRTRELNAALADNAEAVAVAEQRTKLLNSAASKGIALTAGMRQEIEELAMAYGRASAAADRAEAMFEIGKDIDDQMRSFAQAKQEIGVYGEALATLRHEHDLLNAAEDAGIKVVGELTEAERAYVETLRERAAILGSMAQGNASDKFNEDMRKGYNDTIRSLIRERGEIGLTGQALEAYRIETDMLNEARRRGLELSDPELAQLRAYAEGQAAVVDAIRRTRDALAEAREAVGGFWKDWYDGIMDGKNIFASFADAVLDGLSRIATKMMDRAIDKFLDIMFAGNTTGSTGGGGFLDSVFNAVFKSKPNAKGNVYGFANGGAFTNSIVSRPTLFSFARGGALGQMGEAGPEAIMPLKRGPDGSLGVQGSGGGKTMINDVKVDNHFNISGAVTPQDIMRAIRAGSEQTQQEVKRQLMGWLQEIQADGATV